MAITPLSDSSSHAYDSDSTEFHKGEGFQVKRKILYVFFKAFLFFGGCMRYLIITNMCTYA